MLRTELFQNKYRLCASVTFKFANVVHHIDSTSRARVLIKITLQSGLQIAIQTASTIFRKLTQIISLTSLFCVLR